MQRHDIEITSGNLRKLKMKWFYRIRKSIRKNIVTKIVEIQVILKKICEKLLNQN